MKWFYRDYFYFHFYNHPTPRDRRGCYICYEVEGSWNYSREPLKRGVFENQVWGPHALSKGRNEAS